jgi:hypothetical protein
MNASVTFRSIFAVGAMALLSACGSDKLDIPNSLPIVQATLPTSLESSATTLLITENSSKLESTSFASEIEIMTISALKTALFSPGPTDFQYRLKSIDSRLDEMEERAADCADKDAQAWSVPVGSTGIPLTTMYFQCYDAATGPEVSDFKIYFGKKDGFWYLAELQINDNFESSDGESPTMGVLAKIAEDSSTVEAYQITVEKVSGTYYSTITQILADKNNSIFEVSSASSASQAQTLSPGANYTGVGCGVRMKTDSTNVYGTGSFSQASTCAGTTSPCVLASDLTSSGSCGSLSSSLTSMVMDRSSLTNALAGNVAKAIIVDKTGIPAVDRVESN